MRLVLALLLITLITAFFLLDLETIVAQELLPEPGTNDTIGEPNSNASGSEVNPPPPKQLLEPLL